MENVPCISLDHAKNPGGQLRRRRRAASAPPRSLGKRADRWSRRAFVVLWWRCGSAWRPRRVPGRHEAARPSCPPELPACLLSITEQNKNTTTGGPNPCAHGVSTPPCMPARRGRAVLWVGGRVMRARAWGGHAASRTRLLPPLPLQRVALSAARLLMLGLFLPLPTHSRDVCGRLLKGKTN